jgi:hypothetical protein
MRGSANLANGTVTVVAPSVESDSVIVLTPTSQGSLTGTLTVGTITAGQSFVVTSTGASDTATFFWAILDPI